MSAGQPHPDARQIFATASRVTAEQIHAPDGAQQCHKIIQNRLALVGEESVSVGHPRQWPLGPNQETPPMRIYIIGNDGITLCREAPASVTDGEIAVASNEELHAAPLSGKRLLALWNALPVSKSGRRSATAGR